MGPRLTLACALGLLLLACSAAPAAAANREFEGESMAANGPAAVVQDGDASGGRAIELREGSAVAGRVVTGGPAHWIALRAWGSDCLGPTHAVVKVDGVPRHEGPLPAGGYGDVEARLPALPRGEHTVEVVLTPGGGFTLGCERVARIDRVVVFVPFADKSFRNRPLAANVPLDPQSKRMVKSLRRQVVRKPGIAWVNTSTWSVPVYIVPGNQPPARVDSPYPDVQRQLNGAPIPPDARPAGPLHGDNELVVYQPTTDRIWEFHGLRRVGGPTPRWKAEWGGRMDGVAESPGYFTNAKPPLTFGASASRLSLLGGLQMIDELQAGNIDHVVDLVLPNVTQGHFVWPAQASDFKGRAIGSDPIPEGTRFRLPPDLNIDALGLPPYTATVARAIQRYGAVVRDRGGVVAFKAEDPTPRGDDPYTHGIFGGMWPNEDELLARFPWKQLQVLKPPKKKR